MAEREVSLSTVDGVPKISFGGAADAGAIKQERYEIAANDIDAYYDGAHKLIFVIDSKIDGDAKPNVLLVLGDTAGRKWDDVLARDYNIDLETIRPRARNKYQNLDVEYDGLAAYNKLINDYNDGLPLDDALADLRRFRIMAARRNATERLDDATGIIAKSSDTIDKTNDALGELSVRQKELRAKLTAQRKAIGKEPTKRSAAKILRTESQADALSEKIARAKKRLANATRRMAAARDDADAARRTLAAQITKDEIMADEVKPLFEKDPNILDENIAFKPIEFEVGDRRQETGDKEQEPAPIVAPLEFTPPAMSSAPEPTPAPTPFSFAPITDIPEVEQETGDRRQEIGDRRQEIGDMEPAPAPVVVEPTPAPAPVAEPVPAPAPSPQTLRPISPIVAGPAVPVGAPNTSGGRPGAMYYIMLILLIALSVFTLWLYQKKTVTTATPDIVVAEPVPQPEPYVDISKIQPMPMPVVEPIAPAPVETQVEVADSEPDTGDRRQETGDREPAPVTVAPVIVEPVPAPAPVAEPVPEPAPVYEKPAYDVSGDRDVFVTEEEIVYEAEQPLPPSAPGEYYIDESQYVPQYSRDDVAPAEISSDIPAPGEVYESYERYDAVYEDEY